MNIASRLSGVATDLIFGNDNYNRGKGFRNGSPISNFDEAIKAIMSTNFDVKSEFDVELLLPAFVSSVVPGLKNYWNALHSENKFNILIDEISVTNPNPELIQEWVGGEWFYNISAAKLGVVTISFRSIDNGMLYKFMKAILRASENEYPDDLKWSIMYKQLNRRNNTGSVVLKNSNLIMYDVSPISNNQSNTGYNTFNVSFAFKH